METFVKILTILEVLHPIYEAVFMILVLLRLSDLCRFLKDFNNHNRRGTRVP